MKAFWHIGPCSLAGVDRRFRSAYCLHSQGDKGECTSEMSVYSETTRCYSPESSHLRTRLCENLKTHKIKVEVCDEIRGEIKLRKGWKYWVWKQGTGSEDYRILEYEAPHCETLPSLLSFCPSYVYVIPSNPCSQTSLFCPPLNVRDRISHPSKPTGKIITKSYINTLKLRIIIFAS
jgi:hypothetical protein